MFQSLLSDFTTDRSELEENIIQLTSRIETIQGTEQEVTDWIALVSCHINIEALDRATIMELVELITVSEGIKVDGKRQQEVQIKYRFIGCIPKNHTEQDVQNNPDKNKNKDIA